MPKLHFKRQLKIDGKIYKKGNQHVPDAALKHPHFEQYGKAGVITEPQAKKRLPKGEMPEFAKTVFKQQEEMAAARKTAAEADEGEQSEEGSEYKPIVGEDAPAEEVDAEEKKSSKKSRR